MYGGNWSYTFKFQLKKMESLNFYKCQNWTREIIIILQIESTNDKNWIFKLNVTIYIIM